MKMTTFLSFSTILCAVWIFSFLQFKTHFKNPKDYESTIRNLHRQLAEAELKRLDLKDQMIEFQVEVSEILPEVLRSRPHTEKNYPLRGLASIVNHAKIDELKVSHARSQFELAKNDFRVGNYKSAREKFVLYIEKYPFSVHIPEAFFLLSESEFRMEDFDSCLKTVEKMLELFPENELTGFALLRTGKIYEYKERPEEAVDIYRAVLSSFVDRNIASQARKSLRSIEL